MFRTKGHTNKKSEDVKKSAGKVLDTKKDTPTRAKVITKIGMFGIIHVLGISLSHIFQLVLRI